MKIGVSSYSFNQYIREEKMTQLDCISKAKELGFDAIEFTEIKPPEGTSKEEYAAILKAEADKLGIEIINYAIPANLVYDTENEYEKIVSDIKKEVDIAKILGANMIRHDAVSNLKNEKSFDLALPKIVRCIREITEYAQTLGIKTMVENHGYICQDSDRVERLYNAVNHDNFGLLVDMGNFLCADENPISAVSRVGRYAFHLHAKDMLYKSCYEADADSGFSSTRGCNWFRGAILGTGKVPVKQCIAIMKRHGYEGDIVLEYEGKEDCIYGITIGFENLKKYIKELGM
ncbi:MAG: sugar phosphate isomerase/epimerase [Ruminococcaceae bacterium]|nr:sugar phosphate isomerase/epimerase [Oscillospiraceae bacterium]